MKNEKLTIRQQILSELMFVQKVKYSELQKITNNHDLFNYHLKEMQKIGYVTKSNDSYYSLTVKGRQVVALMEEDGSSQKPFKVGLFISLVRKHGDAYQMYLYKRLKHPHYGYSGDITAKLKWGDSLKDNLQRELEEELNIRATKYDLIGVFKKTFRDEMGKIMGEGVYFQYVVTEFIGNPNTKNVEGEYYWCDMDEILNQENIFRESLEFSIPKIKYYLKGPSKFSQFVTEQGLENLKY